MRVSPWGRVHVSRRTATGLAVLGLLAGLCLLGAAERASWIVDRLLGDWAAGAIAEQTGGAYQLHLGHTRFDWLRRRIAMDSISLTTSLAMNEGPRALPGLRFGLYDCTISGVRVFALVRGAGLSARSFGCASGHLMVEVPRDSTSDGPDIAGAAPVPPEPGQRQVMLTFQRGIGLPFYAPRVRVDRVAFPYLVLEVRLPRSAGGATRLQLQQLEWTMHDVLIDPADSAAATRLLFSKRIELVATNFTTHPTRTSAVRVGLLRASLTDSTLDARGITFVPVADSAPVYRADRIRLTAGHVAFRGIDFRAFVFGRGARARSVDVDSARLDVLSDERLPEGPRGRLHRTPQQWIADVDQTLSIDSLRVHNGEVVYREHAPGRALAGVITFARIEAVASNIRHAAGRQNDSVPVTLAARAHLQGVGQLDLFAEVPLDAPRFDMTLHGTLGAMAAPALNTFVVETNALRIDNGQVDGVAFSVVVRNGVARGTITPRFNDLSLSVTQRGSGGILGVGGMLGGAARGVVTLAAKLKVRGDNPDGTQLPRVGTIRRTYTPDLTLITFLWRSVRDGLLLVVKK